MRLQVVLGLQLLADALGQRLGSEVRTLAGVQLLDRHVAGGEDLGARDDSGRAVLVPNPDVFHAQVQVRIARLAGLLDVELVAEIGHIRGENAVAEETEDGRVLLLQPQLELGLVLVKIVEV